MKRTVREGSQKQNPFNKIIWKMSVVRGVMCEGLGVGSQVWRGVGLNHSTSFVLVTFYQLTLSGWTTQISRMTNLKLFQWGNFAPLIGLELHQLLLNWFSFDVYEVYMSSLWRNLTFLHFPFYRRGKARQGVLGLSRAVAIRNKTFPPWSCEWSW